jgi:flagellar motor switch protein FliM
MSEILTQKDIDALLRGLTPTEGGQAIDVVPYNFVRPPRVSRERRSALEAVHARFALSLQAMLSSRLRTSIDVTVASVEQVLFAEFLMSLGKPCAAFTFKVGDDASGVMDLGSDFAYCLVDRMFGGLGEPEKIERGLTPLEQTVVRSIAERMVGLLRESWQEHLVLAAETSGFQSDPEAIRIANPDDHVLVANLEIASTGFAGSIAICLPMGSLESFFQERSAVRLAGKGRHRDRASRPQVESCLQHARVTVSARLPALQVTTREVARLEVGQVIHTGSLTDADIEVQVNGRLRFIGTLGQVRRRVGVRVTQAVLVPEPQRRGRLKEGRIT